MNRRTWELASAVPNAGTTHLQIGPRDAPGTPGGWGVASRTLTQGASAGLHIVELHNGRMKLVILASRGMGVWAAEVDGQRLGWRSPIRGPVHPQLVPIMEPTGRGWLEGFDELMVRCGLENSGAPVHDAHGRLVYPLHGKIGNRPARDMSVAIDRTEGAIEVRGVIDEIRFHGQKLRLSTVLSTRFHSASFGWRDKVTNLGGRPALMQMLYHINVGAPLLEPGARLVAPVRTVCPHDHYPEDAALRDPFVYPHVSENGSQQSFFSELLTDSRGETHVLVHNAQGTQGMAVRFDGEALPWFTHWRNNAPAPDGYATALEPGTNFPNPRPFEEQQGRIVRLAPGGAWSAWAAVDWLGDATSVAAKAAQIARIQGGTSPQIAADPLASWSPR